MKKSKKITIGIIIFFLVIALVIIGRYAIGIYFKKKFSKRPPPGVIVEVVSNKSFSQSLESYCTSLSSKTTSYKIKKNELLEFSQKGSEFLFSSFVTGSIEIPLINFAFIAE